MREEWYFYWLPELKTGVKIKMGLDLYAEVERAKFDDYVLNNIQRLQNGFINSKQLEEEFEEFCENCYFEEQDEYRGVE